MKVTKVIRTIAIVIGSTVLVIFLALLLTPIIFKGKIFNIAKTEINKMLTARVDFSDLKLSFLKNFPDAYIALEDVSVVGMDEFEGETLAAFKIFSVTVDIMSVIKMENMQVKSILLDQPVANAHILENGKANWDIVKPSKKDSAEGVPPDEFPPLEPEPDKDISGGTPPEESEPLTLKVALNKFEIRNAALSFTDDKSKIKATIDDLNLLLHGDSTLDNADVDLKLDITGINGTMDGVRLLNNAFSGLVLTAAGDFKNMAFTLKEARFNLNEIVLNLAGSARIGDDIDLDVTFATEKTDFKSVLSMVPAIYMKDFESITTRGNFTLSGEVKGIFNNERMPNAQVNLSVGDAMFKYPDLPKSINNINIAVRAFYDGAVFDNTTADVDKLHFEMAGNPFNAEFHVKTPESDMQVAAKFNGKIDFNSLRDIVPLDDTTLKGLLECDLALAGRMSTIEKERYEDFDARGSLKLTGVNFVSPMVPTGSAQVAGMRLDFTPRRVNLANLDATMGNTDVSMNGSLENFIPFVFKGSTVRGNLNLKSNMIDLNEIMGEGGEKEEKPVEVAKESEEAEPMAAIEVPKNVDFTMNVNIGTILFDKLNIANTTGTVIVKDGKAQMQKLNLNLLKGSMTLNGEYNTQDIKVPSIDFGLDIRRFDITSALSSLSMLENILPDAQNYTGQVSANLTLNGVLDETMSPLLDTVYSKGQLQTYNLRIHNNEIFGKMADFLKNEQLRSPTLNNLTIKYEIKNGRVYVEPIPINVAQTKFELSGSQGFDMTMDYRINSSVPMSAIGRNANDVLAKIPGGSNIREVKVTGLVGGTVSKPDVSLSVADMASNVAQAVTQAVKQEVTERVSAEVEKQRAAVMAEAEKQAQTIRDTAKQSANRVRAEANNAANKLEAEAKNPLQKAAAKIAADKLRQEGEANAVKLEQEANRQVNNIMDAAKKKADSIK
jgi:hypothetical protein